MTDPSTISGWAWGCGACGAVVYCTARIEDRFVICPSCGNCSVEAFAPEHRDFVDLDDPDRPTESASVDVTPVIGPSDGPEIMPSMTPGREREISIWGHTLTSRSAFLNYSAMRDEILRLRAALNEAQALLAVRNNEVIDAVNEIAESITDAARDIAGGGS